MSKAKVMTFWEHIYEIRNRLLVVLISVFVFSIGSYFIFPFLFDSIHSIVGEELYATGIAEGFLTRLRISILGGLFFSIPLFIFQIILFIFPALKKAEKIFILILMSGTFFLFLFGIAFAYKSVLPISMQFLKSKEFFPDNVSRLISYEMFIGFFFQFLIGFGICFQFPVVLIILMKLGVLQVDFLIKNFKFVIAGVFFIAAVITPPDVVSQILLSIPMIILYSLCIIIGKVFKLGK
ncbi:MAG: twin-arginine translocase subunit TatC [Spirochaetales bacterium]|nr:twin-arginine translocase subunit TatC [Spirochaetales bacterium]